MDAALVLVQRHLVAASVAKGLCVYTKERARVHADTHTRTCIHTHMYTHTHTRVYTRTPAQYGHCLARLRDACGGGGG